MLVEVHNLTNGADSIILALYTSSATLGAGTTVYVTTGQSSGTNYSAGGQALTNVTPALSGSTAVCDFADEVFSNVTISAVRGAMIFNDSASGDPSVCILDFGADKAASSGDFTVVFPTADASNAIIRIA